jgi:hypothetical protein
LDEVRAPRYQWKTQKDDEDRGFEPFNLGFRIVGTIRFSEPHSAYAYRHHETKCSKLSIVLVFALCLFLTGCFQTRITPMPLLANSAENAWYASGVNWSIG